MKTLAIAVVGAGAIGKFHARSLARSISGARLAGIADLDEAAAGRVAGEFSCPSSGDPGRFLEDPAVDALVIATPGPTHPELIIRCARAGKPVFCEKPLAWDLESADRALVAVKEAGTLLQIGFQRRFDPGFQRLSEWIGSGKLGAVQLLRSLTRDPKLDNPGKVPPWAIFRETLIHDFDVFNWLSGQEPVEVFAWADALVAPDHKETGLKDTATVQIRYDRGAMAQADASFQAVYGYDVRAEVFGSEGMASTDPASRAAATRFTRAGETKDRVFWFLDLFDRAYQAELQAFTEAVVGGGPSPCSGEEGRKALAVAVAAIESVQSGRPERVRRSGS